jgi:hypothetical protein
MLRGLRPGFDLDVNVATLVESNDTVDSLVVDQGHVYVEATLQEFRYDGVLLALSKRGCVAKRH